MGIEVLGVVSGDRHATYQRRFHAPRGTYDSKTPGAPGRSGRRHQDPSDRGGRELLVHAKLQSHGQLHGLPDTRTLPTQNLAIVPGNVLKTPDLTAPLCACTSSGARIALSF